MLLFFLQLFLPQLFLLRRKKSPFFTPAAPIIVYMKIMSFSPFGYEGALVTVEVDLRRGIPAVDMVGLADNAVRESRERMRAAIRNSGFEFPVERVLISLSPADVKKEGAGFDLAIALAVLHKKEHPEYGSAKDAVLIMGELELSGRIRAVRGVHAALSTAREYGIRKCIIPAENAAEADAFAAMNVFPVRFLTDAFELFSTLAAESEQKNANGGTDCTLGEASDVGINAGVRNRAAEFLAARSDAHASIKDEPVVFSDFPAQLDYREISGQGFFIEALQIAAAGRHNLIAYGPPGCGKNVCAEPLLYAFAASDARRSLNRNAHLQHCRSFNVRYANIAGSALPHAAPKFNRGRDHRRRHTLPPRRNIACAQRRAVFGRSGRLPHIGFTSFARTARRRENHFKQGGAQHRLPGPLSAAFGGKSLPLRQLRQYG